MRTQGTIVSIVGRDKIIARFSNDLDVGSSIYDKRKAKIGQVEWIFGQVNNPYYEIKCEGRNIKRLSMMREELYAEEEQ